MRAMLHADTLRPRNSTTAHASTGNLAHTNQQAHAAEQRRSSSKSCREDCAYTSVQTTHRIQATVRKQSESYRRQRPPPAPSMTHTGCHEEVNICMQLPHGGMRSSLSYLLTLWGRAVSGGTSGASMVPDGKLWHFHRHLRAATNVIRMGKMPQTMLPANEMFKREGSWAPNIYWI